jgi:hypothetical protein
MKRAPAIVLSVLAAGFCLSAAQGQQSKKAANQPSAVVSAAFAKAGNLALAAIENSNTTGENGPDKPVEAAINDVDASAISTAETLVVQQIKLLALMRPLVLESYHLSSDTAAQTGTVNAKADADKADANLAKLDACIAAWRTALHKLSGEKPKTCGIGGL